MERCAFESGNHGDGYHRSGYGPATVAAATIERSSDHWKGAATIRKQRRSGGAAGEGIVKGAVGWRAMARQVSGGYGGAQWAWCRGEGTAGVEQPSSAATTWTWLDASESSRRSPDVTSVVMSSPYHHLEQRSPVRSRACVVPSHHRQLIWCQPACRQRGSCAPRLHPLLIYTSRSPIPFL